MMTSGSSVPSLAKSKQTALALISLMILAQFVVLIPSVGADSPGVPTLRTTFSDGNEETLLNFDGFTFNQSAALEIPQNTTVDALSFSLEYHPDTMSSPGSVWLDIDQDGINEWQYEGSGYGKLGEQTRFSDNSISYSNPLPVGTNQGPDVMLPKNISVVNSLLSIDYTPENNGRWINESSIIDVQTANLDNDSSDEVLVLSSSWDTGNGDFLPAIGWINNNSNNDGYTNISWHETCPFAENLETADFNGDGYDDVLVWTPSVGRFCYHLWNPSQNSFSASNELIGGTIGQDVFVVTTDIDGDGFGDVVWADSSGSYGFLQWRSNINGFELIDEWEYETTSGGQWQSANIEQFGTGDIMTGGPGTLVFVSDQSTVDTMIWDPGLLQFINLWPTFSGMDTEFLWVVDLNADAFDDIVTWGSGTSGNILISSNASGAYGLAPQSGIEAPEYATVVDFDGDGGVDILIPDINVTADNDDTTMNGTIKIYNLLTGLLTDSARTLTPRTMPALTAAGDMNGDGHSEIIAYCGEVEKGIFIDAWHKMSYDFDGDGIYELSVEGFGQAESGPNGSQLFRVSDTTGAIGTTIDLNSGNYFNYTDSYGIKMMEMGSKIDLITAGTVSISNLQLTYSFNHLIEDLYDGSGNNLSTLVNNDYMEFGLQNFTIPLAFNATDAGALMLKNLHLVTYPGHPDLPDLEPLVLLATNVLEDSVELRWSEVLTGSQYFSAYELFRTSVENGSFPTDYSVLATTGAHTNVSHIDTAVSEGGHYEYVVRATFSVGSLSGAISNVIAVSLPSIPRVENVSAADTPMDQGGSVDVSWDAIEDRSNPFTGYYNLFVLAENFSDTTLMDPITTLEHTESTYSASYTSIVRNSSGDIITQATPIEDEQALWVAVVATNASGSNPFVTAVGPVYALNNELIPTQLSMELTDLNYLRENLIAAGNPTVISLHLESGNSAPFDPIEGENISTTIIVDPDGDAYEFNFNSTTDSQGDATIEFNWRDLANESIGVNGGEVEITAVYDGRVETLEKGSLGATDDSIDAMAIVPATFSLNTPSVMVDEYGDATLEVSLIAEHDWQQDALLGTDIYFKYYDSADNLQPPSSQTLTDENGILEAYIDAMPEGGYVLISPDSSANPSNPNAWKYLDTFDLNATLYAYDGSGQTNLDQDADGVIDSEDNCLNTPQGEVDEVELSGANKGCSPSQIEQQIEIIDPTLECPVVEWTIENVAQSQNANRECLLINTNDLFITIEDYPSKITVGGIEIGVNCGLSYIPSNGDTPCVFSPTVVSQTNKSTDESILSSVVVDFEFSWLNQNADTQSKDLSYTLEYYLIGNKTTVVDDNTGTDNTGTDNTGTGPIINEESADSKASFLEDPMMLGLIAGGAILALISIVMIVRFIRDDDDDWDDDWDDDDDDDDMENPLDRILGRTSAGGYDASEPQEGEPFERTLSRGRLSGAAGQEFVRQSQQSNDYEDDPGYSVDEDGTEWWEDEQGQWWYRDPNMDDWEEWNE